MIKKYYLFLIFFSVLMGSLFFSSRDAFARICKVDEINASNVAVSFFSIQPTGGIPGITPILLKASIGWQIGTNLPVCDGTTIYVFIAYNKNNEIIKQQQTTVTLDSQGRPQSFTLLASNIQPNPAYIDGAVIQFHFYISLDSGGSAKIADKVIDFVAQGTGGVCAYVDTRSGLYACGGGGKYWYPDVPSTPLCSLDCHTAAKNAGYGDINCDLITAGQCGTKANLVRYGCLVPKGPSDPTHSTWNCSQPSATDNCNTINCGSPPSSCYPMNSVEHDAGLCGKDVVTGGSNCGGTGQPVCPTPTSGNCGGSGQPACPTGSTTTYPFSVPNPLQGGANTVAELVAIIVKWIFSIAIPIAVAVIVYAGILFLTSKGDPGKVTHARQMLQYAVIGLAVILIGSGFISLIKSILELGAGPTGGGAPTYTCSDTVTNGTCPTGQQCTTTDGQHWQCL